MSHYENTIYKINNLTDSCFMNKALYKKLLAYLQYKLNVSYQDADDIVQDIFIALLNNKTVSIESYAYKACANRAVNVKTRNKYVELKDELLNVQYEQYEEQSLLIPELPTEQMCVLKATLEGMSLSDYAKSTNKNINTVKVNYNIAKKKTIEFNKIMLDKKN